jgi:hypothetical protein
VALWSRLADVQSRWNVLGVAEAEHVLRANWTLLDGIERLCGRT